MPFFNSLVCNLAIPPSTKYKCEVWACQRCREKKRGPTAHSGGKRLCKFCESAQASETQERYWQPLPCLRTPSLCVLRCQMSRAAGRGNSRDFSQQTLTLSPQTREPQALQRQTIRPSDTQTLKPQTLIHSSPTAATVNNDNDDDGDDQYDEDD